MSTNQDPNPHILYQPPYTPYPPSQSMGTWGQPPNQQPYTFPTYPQSDRTSYTDNSGYNNQQYQQVQYGGAGDNDYYRSSAFYNQQPSNQWQQGYTFTAPSNQPLFNTTPTGYNGSDREQPRGNAFNSVTNQLPNMSRPPPNIKRDNGDNTFHASLSMLENPAQASAAYTANWVSNTTTIPPDLKDEPEMFVGLPRDDIGSNVFNPQAIADQFGHLNLGGDVPKEDIRRKEERRPTREDGNSKALTWDERIRKANVQKERAEQRGSAERIAPERERPERENGRGAGPRPPRTSGSTGRGAVHRDGRDGRQQRNNGHSGMMWKNENGDSHEHDSVIQGRNSRQSNPGALPGLMRAPEMPMVFNPNCLIPGQPPMMYPRGMPFMPGPRPYIANLQDERFKNTWLDAAAFSFPIPYGPMGFAMDNRGFRGSRGRGYRGSRGGRSGDYQRRGGEKKENERQSEEHSHEASPVPSTTENNTPAPPVAETQSTA